MWLLPGALFINSVFLSSPFHDTVTMLSVPWKTFADENECCLLWVLSPDHWMAPSLCESPLNETLHNPEKCSACQAGICCRGITVSKPIAQQHSCLFSLSSAVCCIYLLCCAFYSWEWSVADCTSTTRDAWTMCCVGTRMFLKVHAFKAYSPACGTNGRR